jgi:hypothetical protein
MTKNRSTVHIASIKSGQIDINVDPEFPAPLPYAANGPIIPYNFCGLRIRQIGEFLWEDHEGHFAETEKSRRSSIYKRRGGA